MTHQIIKRLSLIVRSDQKLTPINYAYDGIMLDHDLQEQIVTERDFFLSGSNVVKTIITCITPDIPILVHSMNPGCAPNMVNSLERTGISVTRLPMREMTRENFNEWLEVVRESWDD